MLTEDTPEIAALVGGQRRKPDGGRYFVGGVDISFIKGNNEDACACLSVLRMPDLKLVYQRMEMVKLTQPYIPGFLAFREVPALLPLFDHLRGVAPQFWPDVGSSCISD
ncbi:endonuclease V [Elysia marginata]|uniref:Endonuclease V n=1 Tax=Elysia marginata TaxID=1093978 RepID=A0AAV4F346_9GAST|nr:endonuclease V [Elysia marginata]